MMAVVSIVVLLMIDMEVFVNLYGARCGVLYDTAVRRKERLELSDLGWRNLEGVGHHVPADTFATGWRR